MSRLTAKVCSAAALCAAFLGFIDATYLSAMHYAEGAPPCLINVGCEVVLTSRYAEVLGVPVALVGAAYYLVLVLLLVAHLDGGKLGTAKAAAFFAAVGVFASLWFIYLQVFVLTSACLYCLLSAASSALACAFSCLSWRRQQAGI